jgi:glycosyltransferase involved in cell wall biosynthesis
MGKEKTKKLSFLLASFTDGGAERVTINLAKGLKAEGYTIEFVVLSKHGAFIDEIPNDINIYSLNTSSASRSLFPIITYLKTHKPDVFISGKHYLNLIAVLAKLISRSKLKLYLIVHGMFAPIKSPKQQLLPRLVNLLYPFANQIICVSEGVAENVSSFGKLDPRHLKVVHNPVITKELIRKLDEDTTHPWLVSKDSVVLMAVGRLSEEKDFTTLLRSFAIAREERPIRLIILGEGPQREQLESLCDQLHIREFVDLPGYVSNPYSYLKSADLFVLSSITEGLPTVLIEALYCGVPVVSTDCPSGPSEILKDGEYGRLVPVKEENLMAEAIIESLDDKVDQNNLRKRALDFTLEVAVKKYRMLIEE